MLKGFIFAILFWPCIVSAGSNVDFYYQGLLFKIPSGFQVIADLPGAEDFMAFRYGREKGKKYVAFSNLSKDSSVDYGCPPKEFFGQVFRGSGRTSCNPEAVSAFRQNFVNHDNTRIWEIRDMVVYYSKTDGKSFAFVATKDGMVYKIDSDFMGESGIRSLVGVGQ